MKKSIVLLFILLLSSIYIQAQDTLKSGIDFKPLTFEQAIAKSKIENKPVFLYGFATWCHFCEFMKDSVFIDKAVGDYYNKTFICVKFDLEKEGKEINKKIKASSFPQLTFFDSTGVIVHRVTGQKSKDAFLQLGKDALDPLKQIRTYDVKYKNNNLSVDEAPIYFRMLMNAAIEYQPYVNNYLMNIPEAEFTSATTWRIINEFLRDVEQPAMNKFLNKRKEFVSIYSADSIDNRILNNYNASLMMFVQKLDTSSYITIVQKLKASHLDLADKIIAYAELNKNKMKSNWTEYQKLAVPFIENFCKGDFRRLNEVAYTIYERGQSDEILQKAEGWSKEAVKLNDNYRFNHTLACLSFKLKKKEQALNAANHAIELGTKSGTDIKQTTLILEKIQELP